jgi:uncharacterized protein YciI
LTKLEKYSETHKEQLKKTEEIGVFLFHASNLTGSGSISQGNGRQAGKGPGESLHYPPEAPLA